MEVVRHDDKIDLASEIGDPVMEDCIGSALAPQPQRKRMKVRSHPFEVGRHRPDPARDNTATGNAACADSLEIRRRKKQFGPARVDRLGGKCPRRPFQIKPALRRRDSFEGMALKDDIANVADQHVVVAARRSAYQLCEFLESVGMDRSVQLTGRPPRNRAYAITAPERAQPPSQGTDHPPTLPPPPPPP